MTNGALNFLHHKLSDSLKTPQGFAELQELRQLMQLKNIDAVWPVECFTKEEAYEMLKSDALRKATNAGEWREFIALATFWAEREKGKPSQAVEVNGKIGIVQLVLEAQKIGEGKTIEN